MRFVEYIWQICLYSGGGKVKLVEVTIEDALKLCKGNTQQKVLVAVMDLEDQCGGIASFHAKDKTECKRIIRESETVAEMRDEIVNGLQCFSEKQDLKRIEPRGISHTILIVQ